MSAIRSLLMDGVPLTDEQEGLTMPNTTQEKASEPMTAEQIKNMRGVLSLTIGAYAYLMPDALVIQARDNLQKLANREEPHP